LISSGVAGATPLDVQEAAVEDEDESAAPSDTSPLLEVFPVLALLDSARVVLGSSEVPFEFRGAHPELRSGTRFGDESMDNLIVEVQHLIKIQIKR